MTRMKIFLFFMVLVIMSTNNVSGSYAQETVPINFENVDIDESCYTLDTLINTPQYERDQGQPYLEDDLVINDVEAYKDFQKTYRQAENMTCVSVQFPDIDFSQRTLLGKWMHGSCAATGFERSIVRDDEKNEIVYSVNVIEEPNVFCSGPELVSMNLITISKIPENYKVVFLPVSDKSGFQSYDCEDGKMVARDWNGNIVEPRNTPPEGGGVFDVKMNCHEITS